MVDFGLVGGRAAEDRRLPGVKVGVEVYDGDLTISGMDRPEKRQHDRVVATEGDNARVVFSVSRNRNKRLAGDRVVTERGERLTLEQLLVAILDLLDGILVVVRGDRNIAAVNDLEACAEGVDLEWDVVASVQSEAARTCADASRSKTSAGAVRSAGVEGCAEEGNVEGIIFFAAEALYPRKPSECGDAREYRIGGD